ncbi:MAG: hypothetical protein WBD67_03690 [Terracidiphilus sp.]
MTAFVTLGIFVSMVAGCGSSGSSMSGPPGNTTVTLLATSIANDQLTQFDIHFDSITLTSKAGNTVTLLPGYSYDEFIHLNGKAEPLFTASVPEDTYTAASATIGPADFTCFSDGSNGEASGVTSIYGYTPDSQVTVNVPVPLAVRGTAMTVALDLLVSQSETLGGSACQSTGAFSITPTFNLTAATSSQAALTGLRGLISSVSAADDSFTISGADGPEEEITRTGATVTSQEPIWSVSAGNGAVFQGVAGISALLAGMPVEIDANLRPDGSLLASRVSVPDANPTDLSFTTGPLLAVYNFPSAPSPVLVAADTEFQGTLVGLGGAGSTFQNAVFGISGQFANLSQLPFAASFNATSMVAGQMLLATSHDTQIPVSPGRPSVDTITLLPQTINGTVTAVSSDGGFTTYTVTLAGYDLFPQLAVQAYQTTVLADPGTVIVYADSNAKMLNTQPVAVGGVFRFYGLVFNDNGTLRMDCAQVNDGVAE